MQPYLVRLHAYQKEVVIGGLKGKIRLWEYLPSLYTCTSLVHFQLFQLCHYILQYGSGESNVRASFEVEPYN